MMRQMARGGTLSVAPRFQSSVLSTGPFPVVFITNHNPFYPLLFVRPGSIRNCSEFARRLVPHGIGCIILSVDGPNKQVIRNVLEMSAVLQPRTCHGDVVRCALAFHFYQNRQVFVVTSVPLSEWRQELQSFRIRINRDCNR